MLIVQVRLIDVTILYLLLNDIRLTICLCLLSDCVVVEGCPNIKCSIVGSQIALTLVDFILLGLQSLDPQLGR